MIVKHSSCVLCMLRTAYSAYAAYMLFGLHICIYCIYILHKLHACMHRSVTCALQGPPMVGHPLIGVCTTEHAAAVEWQWIRAAAAPTAANGSGGKSPKRSGKGKSGSSSSKQQKAAGFTIELPTSSSRCVVLKQFRVQCSLRCSVVADTNCSYDCWLQRLILIVTFMISAHSLQQYTPCKLPSHVQFVVQSHHLQAAELTL
jgi:hypothetical protein